MTTKNEKNSPNSTAERHHRHYETSEIIAAIEKSGGAVYIAARALGCSYSTIQKRAKLEQEIQAAIDEQRGLLLDKAEIALTGAVEAGESWAVQFALKNLGHGRGYSERQTHRLEVDWRKELREQGIDPDELERELTTLIYRDIQQKEQEKLT